MRRLPAILILIAAVGCGSSDGFTLAPTDSNVAGVFVLQSADGHALPVDAGATVDGTAEIYQTADILSLDGAGVWNESTTLAFQSFVDNSELDQTIASTGTYTIADRQINFVRTVGGAATFIGSVAGNTLTLRFNGSTLVYQRQ